MGAEVGSWEETMDRDEVADDVFRSIPMDRIMAAAAFVIRRQRGLSEDDPHTFTETEIADWIKGLNAEQLMKLRQIAEYLEQDRPTSH